MKIKPSNNDEQFVVNIFKKYLYFNLVLTRQQHSTLQETTGFYPNVNHLLTAKSFDNLKQHYQLVNTILAMMPKNEYIMLVKEFINPKKNWWKGFYSFQVFQKLKRKAIKRFLYLYLV